ncbi:BlaI/MecI/CopY family transcriptional regulator [Maritalea porphyrae]|mgnify:CR=1 FL=1|uniref:BlaI/MecI/CopY family transcriptional regulator n=1 Tax=Maritalea porphyrae TaxID=880732 RepID=UPI0022AFFDA9|nr:BlaI/MecI/CopY family transcriptional regulator [Maritalea porphyrae]MCZ4272502.1 BlaI/MecI/CopY family transcriptional regulator [Maritalea porphyrae]
MARKHDPDFLTSVELEFMNGLWAVGSGTVREIMANMDAEVDRAYTSGATVMRILEQKGFVASDKKDRALVYTPVLSKNEYQGRSIRQMSKSLFDGAPGALVARLVDDEMLTDEMIEQIRSLLDDKQEKSNG